MKAVSLAAVVAAVLVSAAPAGAGPAIVTLPGSFNSELGCSGDWQPDCLLSQMTKAADGFWYAAFDLPLGAYDFKVAYDQSWVENYGANGVENGANLTVMVDGSMGSTAYFRHSELTHLTAVQFTPFGAPPVEEPLPGPAVVTLPGSFNSEVGCSGDWQPDCSLVQMIKAADGLWHAEFTLPIGVHDFKIAYNQSWEENYGQGGVRNGANMVLTVDGSLGTTAYFRHDARTHMTDVQFTRFAVVPTPEPAALGLLGFGVLGIAARRRRKAA